MSDDQYNLDASLGSTVSSLRHQFQPQLQSGGSEKLKMSPLTLPHSAGEDMRILKILRRLQQENNPAAALELCNKLEMAVRATANAAFISRSFDTLMDYMIGVLKQCPQECLEKASIVLGVMGYINRSDFLVYKNNITKMYQAYKSLRKYVMLALKITFSCDAVNLDLVIYSERMLVTLKDYLENAEVADTFMAVSETIAEFSKNYKHAFENHFTDIVDIMVGWHLEIDQPLRLKLHCSTVLQQFAPYFLNNVEFTFDLLMQFLEDIAAIGEEISLAFTGGGDIRNGSKKAEVRVGSFVGAFNSILKSLTTRQEFIGITICEEILNNAAAIIAKTAEQSLSAVLASEETVLNINDFFCLIFSQNSSFIGLVNIEELIALQLKQFNFFNDAQKLSLLHLILSVFQQLRTNLPLSIVTLVFQTTDNPLSEIKLTRNARLQKLFLKLYHEILMIKNVPLLQEAYKHVIADVDDAIVVLETCTTAMHLYEISQAEMRLHFCLAALSSLATQTSSIISMYALHPSILELLISNFKASNIRLWSRHPTLYYALLSVLVVHCQKNHNFRSTSRLLAEPVLPKHVLDENSSPTSENFSTILQLLAIILSDAADMNRTNLNLLLLWTNCLLEECRENATILGGNINFQMICKALCVVAISTPQKCSICIETVLDYPMMSKEVLRYVQQIATLMLDSVEAEVKLSYTRILAKLPLDVSLTETKEPNAIMERRWKFHELQQWYKATTYFAPLRNKYFKPFLEKMEICEYEEMLTADQFAVDVFAKCWIARCRESSLEYREASRFSSSTLIFWLQYEASRQCIRNKLRTAIGKPQETFLAIEAIITKYARTLSTKNKYARKLSVCDLVTPQFSTRILLGFLENLEKHIYNAAEGTAFAIPAIEKPAKTFFRINAHTCSEWLNRIRPSVNLIAIHSMEPEMVVRNSESILNLEKLSDMHMDHTVVSLVWALLNCGEPCALQGLYVWLRGKTGKRFVWVQYASEQAAGHKEQAAMSYVAFLKENGGKLDAHIKEFLTEQLLHCWYYTGQWSEMRAFLDCTKTQKQDSILRTSAYLQLVEGLVKGFENSVNESETLSNAILELAEWPRSFNGNNATVDTFSYYNIIPLLEASCVAQILKEDSSQLTRDVQDAIRLGLQEAACHVNRGKRNAQLVDLYILNHVSQKIENCDSEKWNELSNICNWDPEEDKSTFQLKMLLWTLMFHQRKQDTDFGQYHYQCYTQYLDVASSARREGNANLCQSMLQRFFFLKGFTQSLQEISTQVLNNVFTVNIEDRDLLRGFSELAKCQYEHLSCQVDSINLASAYCSQIIKQVTEFPQLSYPDAGVDMLLTIADWLSQRGTTNASVMNSPQLQHLLRQLPEIAIHPIECHENFDSLIPIAEKAVGRLINASIIQRNNFAEGWYAFGNWCYRWGKRIIEARNSEKISQEGTLSQRDLNAIKEVLGGDISDELVTQLVNILGVHQLNINDADAEEDIEKNEINSTEVIENELRKVNVLSDKPLEQITSIIQIWKEGHRTVYAYYEMATKAYFKYLTIESTQERKPNSSYAIGDCTSVTTTLRLLRLIVKHAAGLQDVLEEGLRTTPLRPWKVIIPQLFSRLNHHEPYVRKSVSDLLCRLARDRPHLIIFPAVVGAHQELEGVVPQCEGSIRKVLHEGKYNGNRSAMLSTCFGTLLHTLSKQAPETVLHVQLLVKELKRVTLLWEEYWVHSLSQVYSEYSSIFAALEVELKKYGECQLQKISEKYEILIKHIRFDLQRIASVTEKEPDTAYERNFQERYNPLIKSTISELQKPFCLNKPFEGWVRIKQLYSIFQQRSMRGCASTLKIADLSPALASMRSTAISMPGVDTFEKNPVFIKSVDSTVHILPTKTKPKKLAFYGSDGRRYTYLFKGLEDLHLDERIMQFLSISNSMMARASVGDSICSPNGFKAHHYSVIPLGPQSGLISWVDGVTPLFGIYKKWQQRDAVLKQQQKERQLTNQNAQQFSVPAATRPSELFYSKLTPLLAEHNIKVSDPRKQWPLSVLRQVLEELIKETPSDLLSKELWCYAVTAADWRKSVRSYSISMAVMSVIGYVIGLGDRHLDNVLIKLSTGEIVHIDYNVCFEKGKTLRVPEKVPFRMTPNLEQALGITGIEGTFRLGCEHVLKILRKERETLLTLLEAFVYDPLVDWTVSDDGTTNVTRATSAYAALLSISSLDNAAIGLLKDSVGKFSTQDDLVQKRQEWEHPRHLIELKFNELKSDWTKHKDEIHNKLVHIDNALQHLMCIQEDIRRGEQERDSLMKQLAMIRELETLGSARGSHALNTITDRYKTYKRDMEAFNDIKKSVQQYQSDTCHLLATYFERLMVTSKESELKNLQVQLIEQQQVEPVNEFEVVRSLLEQKCQTDLYNECVFVRKEMDKSLNHVSWCAMECLDQLQHCINVMQFYPRSRLQKNRLIKYDVWYKKLLREECSASILKHELELCIDEELRTNELNKVCAVQYAEALKGILAELNCEMHTVANELGEHNQQIITPLEITIDEMKNFVALKPEHHKAALQSCILDSLEKTIESFSLYEETMQNSEELLSQQLDFIEMCQRMCRIAFPDLSENNYAETELLESTLKSLEILKSALEQRVLPNIVRLFMLDDVPKLQEVLALVCSSSTDSSLESLEQEHNNGDTEELCTVLAEIRILYQNFESGLNQLDEAVMKALNSSTNTKFAQFVVKRFVEQGLHFERHALKGKSVIEIFCAARDSVNSLKVSDVRRVYDIRAISIGIRKYITQLQMSTLCGLPSFFVNLLHDHAIIAASMQDHIQGVDENILLTASGLCQNFILASQKSGTKKRCQQQMLKYRKWLEHQACIAKGHFWANDRYLRDMPSLFDFNIAELHKSLHSLSQSLSASKITIIKIHKEVEQHKALVNQHFSWTVETNCSLLQLQECFIERANIQEDRYNFYVHLIAMLIDYVQTLLRFELHFQSDPGDQLFSIVLQQWEEASERSQLSAALITPVEQAIVQLLDPEGNVDQCWIENIAGLLDEMTFSVQRRLANLEQEEQSIIEDLYDNGQELEAFMESPIRLNLRHLLKQISKIDRNNKGTVTIDKKNQAYVRDIQYSFKTFYSLLGELQMLLMSRNFVAVQMRDKILRSINSVEYNHNNLLNLMYKATQNNEMVADATDSKSYTDDCKYKSGLDMVDDSVSTSNTADKKGMCTTNQVEQKRNAYGVSVWKRVRMKLEGRDPDPNRRSSVIEQVDFVIREAMNPDNLAVLYEGWTPWV